MNMLSVNESKMFEAIHNAAVVVRDEHCRKRLAGLYSAAILRSDISVITLDDLCGNVFLPDSSCRTIAEDKRIFAFYRTVRQCGPKQKDGDYRIYPNDWAAALQLTGYFGSVNAAQQFYALFEELNSQIIPFDEVESKADNDKQRSDFRTLREIYKALQTFLNGIGLTDRIYYRTKSSLDANITNIMPLFNSYHNVIFLDCYGSDALTGQLIGQAQQYLAKTKNVSDVWTLPYMLCDPKTHTLSLDNIKFDKLIYDCTDKSFSFVKASNEAEVYYKAISTFADSEHIPTDIIDLDTDSPYKHLLRQEYKADGSMPYYNCRLYVWLDTAYKLLDSVICIRSGRLLLADINVFRDAIYTQGFIGIYFTDEDEAALSALRHFVDDGIESGLIYWDLDGQQIQYECDYLSEHADSSEAADKMQVYARSLSKVQLISEHLHAILNAKNAAELKDFLYSKIAGSRFFGEAGLNALEIFWTAMEDTKSIESLGIVDNWTTLFPERDRVPQVGLSLLRILTDYLKDQKILLSDKSAQSDNQSLSYVTIDTYDRKPKQRLILINMNDKIFPRIGFKHNFLSESQRNDLGLPNADDIAAVQKLLLCDLVRLHSDIMIISLENIDKDQAGSGFIDELRYWCLSAGIPNDDKDISFGSDYLQLLTGLTDHKPDCRICDDTDSLAFRFDPHDELRGDTMHLSASRLKKMLEPPKYISDPRHPRRDSGILKAQIGKNQYSKYYLDSIIGTRFFEQERIPRISNLTLGNIVHDLFRDILTDILGQDPPIPPGIPCSLSDPRFSDSNIKNTAQHIISNMFLPYRHSYLYKIPDDWTKDFLQGSIFPYSIRQFCGLIDYLRLTFHTDAVLTPETEYDSLSNANKTDRLTAADINEYIKGKASDGENVILLPDNIKFRIDGRADFRANDTVLNVIADYKTGSPDSNNDVQLALYEWSYSEQAENNGYETLSFFFNIFSSKEKFQKRSDSDKTSAADALYGYIYKAVSPIFSFGYFVPNERYYNEIKSKNYKDKGVINE